MTTARGIARWLIWLAFISATFGISLPQKLLAQESVDRPFAPLEVRASDAIQMVQIPAGSFTMGSEKYRDENPPHSVYVRGFLIGKTEVTQKQWMDVMGRNPSRFTACGIDCPVESVSWDDVQRFIAKLNQSTGQKYRLPSEAEWEYAAKAGTTTEWSFGSDESKLGDYAWYGKNSFNTTQKVGQKLPNAFGLFDMYGNVAEWVADCAHQSYVGAPTIGSPWTTDCEQNFRVVRGGSWMIYFPPGLRSAFRDSRGHDSSDQSFGFRLARDF
jgi:formylglycine-generating enzyme required for sulfatase activity